MSSRNEHTSGSRNAVVTGCAGFVGSHLTERLLEDGWDVTGVDCFNDNYGRHQKLANLETANSWDNFTFVPLDLANGDLGNLVTEKSTVFHLAAEPGVRASWGDRFATYVRNNILATQLLLEAARVVEARVVYASSSSVYGQAEVFPTPESATPRPFSPYGVTKLAAENLCLAYTHNFGLETVSLRFFTVYGPRQRPDMAFTRLLSALSDGTESVIYGDGRQSRDFTFIADIVDALIESAIAPEATGGVFNLGGGSQVELLEVIRLMEEISGRQANLRFTDAQAGDVRMTGADTSRARTVLGFDPRTTLRQGLKEQWDWIINLDA